MQATIVTTDKELRQIVELSQQNHKSNITAEEQDAEGFISWQYSIELLKQMHALHPNIIAKDEDILAGYAMVAFKAASAFHKDLAGMIHHVDEIFYDGKPLRDYNYYIMGQVCVDKAYRGKGVFNILYQHHKTLFQHQFDFVVTEISAKNLRSIRAHEKVGFNTIHTYSNAAGDWLVVLWDWR